MRHKALETSTQLELYLMELRLGRFTKWIQSEMPSCWWHMLDMQHEEKINFVN